MVAGKSPISTQALTRAPTKSSPKLPPLPKLTIRRPVEASTNPCLAIMASMLGCWASNGHTTGSCVQLETSLRSCMDARKPSAPQKSPINSQLSRLYPQIRGPYKRK